MVRKAPSFAAAATTGGGVTATPAKSIVLLEVGMAYAAVDRNRTSNRGCVFIYREEKVKYSLDLS